MTPEELSNRVSGIADKAEKSLSKAVTTAQRELLSQMESMLSGLELDSEGLIKQSQANRKILQKADRIFDRAIKESGYYSSLDQFAGTVSAITGANEKYFDFILESFTVDAQYLKSLQKGAISTIEGLLANDGLEAQLKQPLVEILNQNVNTGASFSDLLKQVREFIVGSPDREGKLMRYSKQISRDALFNFSRALQEGISQNAGLEYYQYLGGIMDDTRSFCAARSNKYYHKKEVEAWAKLGKWDGRRPGTTSSTIFVYAGGYGCLHQIIPVSREIVPKDVIERNEL
jgi:hypothetical protein